MKHLSKENLIAELTSAGYLKNPKIIEAFTVIDRKDFIREENLSDAYVNHPLSIDFNQTISQPLTVAFMLELLEPGKGEKILDVGAGSGWQTALLAHIVGDPPTGTGRIFAIERIPELKNFAEQNISKYNFIEKGVAQIKSGDGALGWREEKPFDKIIAAASAAKIPKPWQDQLKIGGRIVAPIGNSIFILDKLGPEKFRKCEYFGFKFVPLVSKFYPQDEAA
jgi:protein-L-isoaspartate(D-aspartate) O-methyltransferase